MEVRDEFQLFEDAANSMQGTLRGEVDHKISENIWKHFELVKLSREL